MKVFVFLLPVLIFGTGFALSQITFNNTTLILAGQNIFITQPTLTSQICPADGNVAYKNSGFTSLAWTLTQGGASVQAFFCMDNQGTSADTPSVTASGTGIANGACPSTASTLTWAPPSGVPTTLAAHTATSTPITMTVCAGSGTSGGTGPSFTVTVT
ncbi:hypothetical protein E6H13_00005 [Candidatus Bathyarchaeota archaeon]|nr:MAG: hypothetical protein E6H13_00005 [Candidatus Bathyarchaeota archaeon]